MFKLEEYIDVSTEEGQLKIFQFTKLNLLNSLRLENCFTDLVIIVEDVEFSVHSEVLSAATDFFRHKLQYETSICQGRCNLDSVSALVFRTILNFIYTGLLCLSRGTVSAIYSAADFMCIPQLVEECQRWLIKGLPIDLNADEELIQTTIDLVAIYQDAVLMSHLNAIFSYQLSRLVFEEKKLDFRFIAQLGVENFRSVSKESKVLMRKSQRIIMGKFYEKQIKELFSDCFPDEEYCLTQEEVASQYFSHPSCTYLHHTHVAEYPTYDLSYSEYEPNMVTTCVDFPVERWTISGLTVYALPVWGKSKRIVAGVDVEYRDIWTGERREFLCELNTRHRMKYPSQKLSLCEGETITSVKLFSGWLVDKMLFSTNQSREHVFFEKKSGGGLRFVDRSMPHSPIDVKSRFEYHLSQRFVVQNRALALHGFTYNLIRTCDSIVWANVYFIFSGLGEEDAIIDDCSQFSLVI